MRSQAAQHDLVYFVSYPDVSGAVWADTLKRAVFEPCLLVARAWSLAHELFCQRGHAYIYIISSSWQRSEVFWKLYMQDSIQNMFRSMCHIWVA